MQALHVVVILVVFSSHSIIAGLGLAESSSVSLVASMLISPLMVRALRMIHRPI